MSAEKYKTSIGGQAIIEGVMMRGPKEYASAVRKPDGEIIVEKHEVSSIMKKYKFLNIFIIRGIIAFVESLVVGMKSLMFSAEFFDVEEEPSKFDKWLDEKLGEKAKTFVIYLSVFISIFLCVGMFILLPALIAGIFFKNQGDTRVWFNLVDGIVKIGLLLGYIVLISKMQEIQRVFEYHGAEHKTIFCYEAGEELTVENVRKQSRLHPRCGTSFLLIVMVISIIVFSFFTASNVWIALLQRLLLIPLIAGVSYEIIKFVGKSENKFICIFNKPGMWFQRFTTREPDDSQIEVAIASLLSVIPEDKEEAKW